ncbi:hypothetical protein K488DRAFT_91797 [Vararia minispora EC-137]|uniref:Uncharacterized protein n=1 Tax=Vararia minispora EC-137 TaxID=1314806 RepID=A0ACB8Q5F6_9AGAM|nr:hypothetical protein K488DRAFT_91797 [Vararia minispora EC-137]
MQLRTFPTGSLTHKKNYVDGYLFPSKGAFRQRVKFDALVSESSSIRNLPLVLVDLHFSLPKTSLGAVPFVDDSIVWIDDTASVLVSGYSHPDASVNEALLRLFPSYTWRGKIAVVFLGKWKPYLTRPPPSADVNAAVLKYVVEGVLLYSFIVHH